MSKSKSTVQSSKQNQAFVDQGKSEIQAGIQALKALEAESTLLRRSAIGNAMGMSYDGARDLYAACGYKQVLSFDDYWRMYKRNAIAKRVVHAFPDACWAKGAVVWDSEDDSESDFESAFASLVSDRGLWSVMRKVDRLMRIGAYGVLFLGVRDVSAKKPTGMRGSKKTDEYDGVVTTEPSKGQGSQLIYAQAFNESNASIASWETDASSARYGLPKTYSLKINGEREGTSRTLDNVHWSRVVHFTEDSDGGDITAASCLEPIYNNLQNIETVVGGGSEMFWRQAFGGTALVADPEVRLLKTDKDDIKAQMDEYIHNLRRVLMLQGVRPVSFGGNISSGQSDVTSNLWMISAASGIPYRILTGAESGELASSQDQDNWLTRVDYRCNNQCIPMLQRVINRLVWLGILPVPEGEINVEFPFSKMSPERRMTVNTSKLAIAASYTNNNPSLLIPQRAILTDFMDIDQDVADQYIKDAEAEQEEKARIAEEEAAKVAEEKAAEEEARLQSMKDKGIAVADPNADPEDLEADPDAEDDTEDPNAEDPTDIQDDKEKGAWPIPPKAKRKASFPFQKKSFRR